MELQQRVNRGENTLVLTYNRALCEATTCRINQLFPDKAQAELVGVATYHECLGRLLGAPGSIQDDLDFSTGLDRLYCSVEQSCLFNRCTLLIIDEAQDLRELYFNLIVFLLVNGMSQAGRLQVLAVGDSDQLLYSFFGPKDSADCRFASELPTLLKNIIPTQFWRQRALSVSWRLPPNMAHGINTILPQHTNIIGAGQPSEFPVEIHVMDLYTTAATKVQELLQEIDSKSVLILSNSLNLYSPAANVISTVQKTHPICVVRKTLDSICLQNRVIFRTLHGSKGLESDVVIIINRDELLGPPPLRPAGSQKRKLSTLAGTDNDGDWRLNNALFVGLTRARQRLIVLQDYQSVSHKELLGLASRGEEGTLSINIHQLPLDACHARYQRPVILPRHIGVDRLFAFLPCSHTGRLLAMVSTRPLLDPAPIEDVGPDFVLSTQGDTFVDVEQMHLYCVVFSAEMKFRESVGLVGLATLPSLVIRAVSSIEAANDGRHRRLVSLKKRAQAVIPKILNEPDPLRRMVWLAEAGLLCEAVAGRMELMDVDRQCVLHHHNTIRIERLVAGLQQAFALQNSLDKIDVTKLGQTVGRTAISMKDTQLLTIGFGSTLVLFSQGVEFVTNDKLLAAGMSALSKKSVYLINSYSGEMLQVEAETELLVEVLAIKQKLMTDMNATVPNQVFYKTQQDVVTKAIAHREVLGML